ncbi:MAG: uL15 family ribosomal protein [Candidatus Diapherotrites archaeon]|nr:uL15 family ribosomal protein [Candidatus Diapherotrites archaeon]
MNKKKTTKELIQILEKKAEKGKNNIYSALAKILSKPRKSIAKVNLWKLSKIAEKNTGKTLIVCGKILATGNASAKINAYAFEFSENAAKKINEAKGKINLIEELFKEKIKEEKLLLVK